MVETKPRARAQERLTDRTPDVATSRRQWPAIAVIFSAALYRSIEFWTVNASELSSPWKILIVGLGLGAVGVAVLLLLTRRSTGTMPVALAVGGLIFLLMSWQKMDSLIGIGIAVALVVFGWVGRKAKAPLLFKVLATSMIVALGLVPLLQLITAHLADAEPYSLVELAQPVSAAPSGAVEDVVVVIVDTYPNLRLAESWFGHDPAPLVSGLTANGLTVETDAWSRHTFTALSVSSILQMHSVIEAGPTKGWGNRSSLFRILRGENFVSGSLQSAGFEYTHIASGWDGTTCGPTVDRCVDSPWHDEQLTRLLAPTVLHDWAERRHHFLTGTFNTAKSLQQVLEEVGDNDSHDYVFAHFLFPHDPLMVDAKCEPVGDGPSIFEDRASRMAATSAQMSCVDRLLIETTANLDDDTAILVTGDHGTATGEQVADTPDLWSDSDIASVLVSCSPTRSRTSAGLRHCPIRSTPSAQSCLPRLVRNSYQRRRPT